MSPDLYSLSAYQFELPQELIAQYPVLPRDHSRLMIVDRRSGSLSEIQFGELRDFLQPEDSLVFNNTKVIPARLMGKRENGGEAEVFLVKRLSLDTWEVLARPGKKLRAGSSVFFSDSLRCVILETLNEGVKRVRFEWSGTFEEALSECGHIPLPHYIRQGVDEISDREHYQTVFAEHAGAVAAPTAGLHFTSDLLESLHQKGVNSHFVTLHVGMGTFKPVQVDDIRDHPMHSESFVIDPLTAMRLNQRPKHKRQICVGTTSCRTLESSSDSNGVIQPGTYDTSIFIYPGYQFKYVESLLTNFHLPGSSLIMLISAFAGYELIQEAYKKAIAEKFRFYSYGDAMLIL
jgi:S-adenosylmethionine:tRNA ribosyltransferase-isomerase